MKLSQYNYSFSPDMLAKYPAESRDESRLMVLNRRTGKIEHKVFKEMIDYFRQGDVLVFNDTKVFPARLYGNKEKTGAEIEIFLLRELNRDLRLWDVLVDPARKIRIGNKLYFGDDDLMVAEVIDNAAARCASCSTAITTNSRPPCSNWARRRCPSGYARKSNRSTRSAIRRFSRRTREPSPRRRPDCISAST